MHSERGQIWYLEVFKCADSGWWKRRGMNTREEVLTLEHESILTAFYQTLWKCLPRMNWSIRSREPDSHSKHPINGCYCCCWVVAVVTGRMLWEYPCESFQTCKEPCNLSQWIRACKCPRRLLSPLPAIEINLNMGALGRKSCPCLQEDQSVVTHLFNSGSPLPPRASHSEICPVTKEGQEMWGERGGALTFQ